MKVISNHKVFDFDKVFTLSCRESIYGNGCPIEVEFVGSSFTFYNVTEIARLASHEHAKQLVCAITEAWAKGTPIFDVDEWIKNEGLK